MTATLQFNLPEDQREFEIATTAPHLVHVIEELDRILRSHTKMDDPPEQTYQDFRDLLWEHLSGDDRVKALFA